MCYYPLTGILQVFERYGVSVLEMEQFQTKEVPTKQCLSQRKSVEVLNAVITQFIVQIKSCFILLSPCVYID